MSTYVYTCLKAVRDILSKTNKSHFPKMGDLHLSCQICCFMKFLDKEELVNLKEGPLYLFQGGFTSDVNTWNQPAVQRATDEKMVSMEPELISCASSRPNGYSSKDDQKSQLIKDQGRRGGLTTGAGKRPVFVYCSWKLSCGYFNANTTKYQFLTGERLKSNLYNVDNIYNSIITVWLLF